MDEFNAPKWLPLIDLVDYKINIETREIVSFKQGKIRYLKQYKNKRYSLQSETLGGVVVSISRLVYCAMHNVSWLSLGRAVVSESCKGVELTTREQRMSNANTIRLRRLKVRDPRKALDGVRQYLNAATHYFEHGDVTPLCEYIYSHKEGLVCAITGAGISYSKKRAEELADYALEKLLFRTIEFGFISTSPINYMRGIARVEVKKRKSRQLYNIDKVNI